MFPLYELLSHAESTRPRAVPAEIVEARRSPRVPRFGNLMLFPCIERPELMDDLEEEPRLIAALSNVSPTGVGLVHSDEIPTGMRFDVQWETTEATIPLRFEVVHSRPTSAGLYRTGARLICGELPELPMPSAPLALPVPGQTGVEITPVADEPVMEADESVETSDDTDYTESDSFPIHGGHSHSGILRFEPDPPEVPDQFAAPAPPGTFVASSAFGFDKTEQLDGVTTCGWERAIEMRRVGNRLWIYIHSPGKKNGWGIFVDPDQFESAFSRIQSAAESSPFATSLAA